MKKRKHVRWAWSCLGVFWSLFSDCVLVCSSHIDSIISFICQVWKLAISIVLWWGGMNWLWPLLLPELVGVDLLLIAPGMSRGPSAQVSFARRIPPNILLHFYCSNSFHRPFSGNLRHLVKRLLRSELYFLGDWKCQDIFFWIPDPF